MLLKACLNGARRPTEHARVPLTPAELARDAVAVVAAGAGAIHVHPRASDGRESLDGDAVGAAVNAVRGAVPQTPIGVTTGAWVEPDPERRIALIDHWPVRPDFASVNFSEDGAARTSEILLAHGVGVEAGLWTAEDVERLARSGIADQCLRMLLEPFDQHLADALATVEALEVALDKAGIGAPRLLHGLAAMAWPLVNTAIERGYDTRIGLEDVLVLDDGKPAADNAELVAAAQRLVPAS
jgi:uncharacterized protein (DUF849 family)